MNGNWSHADESYMQRCLELASKGAVNVAPNPMVGAVLVFEDRIIGEGFHERFGEAHAEVNCLQSVPDPERQFISAATLYVSLEPCAHHGKTPPCADLIIRNGIRRVVIGCRDPFTAVDGRGMAKLESAGITVIMGVLEAECRKLNRRFLHFHEAHRPYIILKWAETADGRIDGGDSQRLRISNELSQRLVHRWRSEEAAILVGTRTAGLDNPQLTNRLWTGPSPLRIVIDVYSKLPADLHLFDGSGPTLVFSAAPRPDTVNVRHHTIDASMPLLPQLMHELYRLQILSVLVEGGAKTLQSFIDASCWDEARIIRNTDLKIGSGTTAPTLPASNAVEQFQLGDDEITIRRPASIPVHHE